MSSDVRSSVSLLMYAVFFFFQAEDGIRDLVRSRGLGDVYKRQVRHPGRAGLLPPALRRRTGGRPDAPRRLRQRHALSLIHI